MPKRQHVPRVLLSREEIWLVAAPGARVEYGAPVAERRGRLALSAYALYSDAGSDTEFAEFVFPVLLAMSASRATTLLALVESVSAFDVEFLHRRIAIGHELSMPTIVEVDEYWPRAAFERLLSARANYLRIGADLMRGAARDPEKLRDLVELTDVARVRQLQIVGSSRDPIGDARALRAARIELMQFDAPRALASGTPGNAALRRDGGGAGTAR